MHPHSPMPLPERTMHWTSLVQEAQGSLLYDMSSRPVMSEQVDVAQLHWSVLVQLDVLEVATLHVQIFVSGLQPYWL